MNTAVQLTFPTTQADRLSMNFRHAAGEILAGSSPALMEAPGLSSVDIGGIQEGLSRFALDLEAKEQQHWEIKVPRDSRFDEPDDGVVVRSRRSDKVDDKLFFHYRPDLPDLLLQLRGIKPNSWQKRWLEHMDAVWSACAEAYLTLATELDRRRPGFNFATRIKMVAPDNHVLRGLWYTPHTGTLAEWHSDRSAITFHVAESSPGLQVARHGQVISESSPQAPEVLAFSGDQFAKVVRNEVPALYHTVNDTTGGTKERFALVFFGKMYTGKL